MKDLDRIKQYVGKLQQAAGKPVAAASKPVVEEGSKRLTINVTASRRVIAHVSSSITLQRVYYLAQI
jgi:hypothetical protein